MLYGTAWKKERTKALVIEAVLAGFRGIDTACQPKHYRQDLVGDALEELYSKHGLKRSDLFLQTKFTSLSGQDRTEEAGPLPYDADASLAEQVAQSFATSLRQLRTSYVDSLVLHSPMPRHEDSLTVWRVFEQLHGEGRVHRLGISNEYDLASLKRLYAAARVKPSIVQNRFYAKTQFDAALRAWALRHELVYQSFWTLTANPDLLQAKPVRAAARAHGWTAAQTLFRYLIEVGCCPLTGTTDGEHMAQDLAVCAAEPGLSDSEREALARLVGDQ